MNCQCGICGQDFSKYKCPKCFIAYCSLHCWKNHKVGDCTPPVTNGHDQNQEVDQKKVYEFETEDTVPIEKLELLENDSELHHILQNPHVRTMLLSIDKASDPAAAIQAAMVEPIFVEFADRCLKLVEPPSEEN